jgi:hypothetical protein
MTMKSLVFSSAAEFRIACAGLTIVDPFARRRGDRMSNCVVGSGRGGMPLGVVAEHGVEGYNHLAHHSSLWREPWVAANLYRKQKKTTRAHYDVSQRASWSGHDLRFELRGFLSARF